jgi:hypothetical protein
VQDGHASLSDETDSGLLAGMDQGPDQRSGIYLMIPLDEDAAPNAGRQTRLDAPALTRSETSHRQP